MRSTHYILQGILDYKEKVTLLGGEELVISKKFENNLRVRNPQLGIVECMPPENPLKLSIGDIVAVNHFSFYGDIAKDKDYQLQEHFDYGNKKLFKVQTRDIYFRYNDKKATPLEGIIICEPLWSPDNISGIIVESKIYKDRATVISGNSTFPEGTIVFVKPYCLYEVELDRIIYYRVRTADIIGIIDEELIPTEGNMIIQDIEEKESELDLSFIKKKLTVKSTIIHSSIKGYEIGDTVIGWRSTGVPFENYRIVNLNDDHIAGKWK